MRILKNREIVRYTDVISKNKRWKGPFMIPLQTILAKKTSQHDETVFKLCHFYCLSICLILTVFRFLRAKLHFRFQNLSVFGHAFLLRQERSFVEVLAARLYNLQSWRHKAIWLEPSTADLCTHYVWTATLARTHACNCKLYACKSLCIYFSLNVIYLCWLCLVLQKYALFNVF